LLGSGFGLLLCFLGWPGRAAKAPRKKLPRKKTLPRLSCQILELLPIRLLNIDVCSICKEWRGNLEEALSLPCGHAPFHEDCGRKWLSEYGNSCPICQRPADPTEYADEYGNIGCFLPPVESITIVADGESDHDIAHISQPASAMEDILF
jgi:hypothetical protein